jgi:FdhE protein
VTLEDWLTGHSYLRPLSRVVAAVESAVSRVPAPEVRPPAWDAYDEDHRAGVPLLSSPGAGVDFEPAGEMTRALVERLDPERLSGRMPAELAALREELARQPEAPRRISEWLLGAEGLAPSFPGLLRYLGWSAAARYLRPLQREFEGWREDRKWLRGQCPTCGALPAMAQLVGADQGRRRLLICGHCRTRWEFPRTGCPFCGVDGERLAILSVEGERGLRLDYCESCRGYVKTYAGEGEEGVLLSDWTSLHLDVAAQGRGLVRRAVSLYDLGEEAEASAGAAADGAGQAGTEKTEPGRGA